MVYTRVYTTHFWKTGIGSILGFTTLWGMVMYGVWFWVYQSTHFIPMFVELYRSTGLSQSGQYPTLFPFFFGTMTINRKSLGSEFWDNQILGHDSEEGYHWSGNTLPVPLPSLSNCRSFKPMCRPLPPYLLQRPCLLPSWKIGKTLSRQHSDFRLEIGVVHILKTSLKVFWYEIYIYSRYRKYCISKSMYIVYSHHTGSPFVSCWNGIISKRETTRFPTKQVLLRILNHAMAFPALSHGASPWVQMLKSSWSICPFQGWNSEVRMESIWLSEFDLSDMSDLADFNFRMDFHDGS